MAISLVQSNSGAIAYNASLSFASNVTAGNCIVVCAGFYGQSPNVPAINGVTIGGSADNFTKAIQKIDTTNFGIAATWIDPNCAGGSKAVAVNVTNLLGVILYIYEVAGLSPTNPLDQSKSGISTGGATSWTSGSTPVTTFPQEFLVGYGIVNASATPTLAITGTSGWINGPVETSANLAAISGYEISSAAGITRQYQGSVSPASSYLADIITLAGPSTEDGTVTLTGAGTAAANANIAGSVVLAGKGVLTKPAVTSNVSASLAGKGTTAANPTNQITPITVSGAGAVTATASGPLAQITAAGRGVVSAAGTIRGADSVAGAGSVTANAFVQGIYQASITLSAASTATAASNTPQITMINGAGNINPPAIILRNSPQLSGEAVVDAEAGIAGVADLAGSGKMTGHGESTIIVNVSGKSAWKVFGHSQLQGLLTWGVRQQIVLSGDPEYNLNATVKLTGNVRFHDYAVKRLSGKIAWNDSNQSVNVTGQISWGIFRTVSVLEASAFNVLASRYILEVSKWQTLRTVTIGSFINWQTRDKLQLLRNSSWEIRASRLVKASSRWAVYAELVKSQEIHWNDRSSVVKSGKSSWNFITTVDITGTSSWNLLKRVQIGGNSNWVVTGRPVINGLSLYNTFLGQTLSGTIEWTIGPLAQAGIRQTALEDVFFAYPGT